jgi:anti-sigma regulatory factor (Ser/Thr protein kinase)
LVAEVCAGAALSGDLCFVATLLTSELVTNAILHAGTEIEVEVTLEAGRARVAVKDRNSQLPEPRTGPRDATTGRGLRLVAAMASAWGAERIDDGKVVWFDLIVDSSTGGPPMVGGTRIDAIA